LLIALPILDFAVSTDPNYIAVVTKPVAKMLAKK
jgi:hypothetical protein